MLDVSVSYNRYKFIGHEFLTWLWYRIDQESEIVAEGGSFQVGNRVVIENRLGADSIETVTVRGDNAGMEEAYLALRKGALVTEMNMVFREGDQEWQFTLKGESLHLSSLKVPTTEIVKRSEEFEGAVLDKTYLVERVISAVRNTFSDFIKLRISETWKSTETERIRKWLLENQPPASA
jgi:hypothetical protein